MGGAAGTLAATIEIFLPAFVLVFLLSTGMEKFKSSPRTRSFLDAVNAASLADAGVFLALLVIAFAALCFSKTNSLWLILAGALAGYLLHGRISI